MVLSLSELLPYAGVKKHFEVPLEMEEFGLSGNSYRFKSKGDVNIDMTVPKQNRIVLNVKALAELIVPCDRCLTDTAVPLEVDAEVKLDFGEDADEEESTDVSFIDGYELDTDRLVYEEMLLAFPMKVLCREDCKGICRVCGKNLNEGECGCDRTQLDPRMAAIRDIYKAFSESHSEEK